MYSHRKMIFCAKKVQKIWYFFKFTLYGLLHCTCCSAILSTNETSRFPLNKTAERQNSEYKHNSLP